MAGPLTISPNSEGCHSCPHWAARTLTTGHCWCPLDVFKAKNLEPRTGATTCFAHICPAHPKYDEARR